MAKVVKLASWVWWAIKFLLATIASAALMALCHHFRWYPDRELYRLMLGNPSPLGQDAAFLLLVLVVALVFLFAEHWAVPALRHRQSSRSHYDENDPLATARAAHSELWARRFAGEKDAPPGSTTGIRITGADNKFDNITVEGFDTGVDLRETAKGNQFTDSKIAGARPVMPAIALSVDDKEPFFETQGGVYSMRRTFKIKVENLAADQVISACKLSLLSVTPACEGVLPWIIAQDFSLAAGDYKFFPFVSYGEARDPKKYPCADSFMQVLPAASAAPTLSRGEMHFLDIRATGIGSAPRDKRCKIWINEDGRLSVSDVSTL